MAKKWRFALQAVLDYRLHVEEEARRTAAELRRIERAHRSAMERCENLAIGHMRALRGGVTLNVAEARACEFQLTALRTCAGRLVAEVSAIWPTLQRARRDVVEAARDRRAIEIIRDRRHGEFVASQRRAEEEEIAELARRSLRR